ncbi:response regulator [Gemmata palustris]|uniref:response regulator n=1 Tax=Gemmata palustris TaxID=2822762 RepID=UPI0028F45B51|nr:response regulator [Gemmata palustris]
MSSGDTGQHAPEGVPPLRVLYIDDNRDLADSAVDLLRLVGFDARACYEGETALAEAREFLPALYLIDLNMPGMNGDELAVRLREQTGGKLVLIAITAMSDESSRARIKAAGFDLHLVKPVDPHKLLSVVDVLWQTWKSDHEPASQGNKLRT